MQKITVKSIFLNLLQLMFIMLFVGIFSQIFQRKAKKNENELGIDGFR